MQEVRQRSPTHPRKRRTVRRLSIRKRHRTTSALSCDDRVSGVCDNDGVGIQTRRMSAATADACSNQKSADLKASENVNRDNGSRLSSASTAAACLPTEVTGLFLNALWSPSCKCNIIQCNVM